MKNNYKMQRNPKLIIDWDGLSHLNIYSIRIWAAHTQPSPTWCVSLSGSGTVRGNTCPTWQADGYGKSPQEAYADALSIAPDKLAKADRISREWGKHSGFDVSNKPKTAALKGKSGQELLELLGLTRPTV